MSIQEAAVESLPSLTESFISTGPEFEELGEQITANIECLQDYVSRLQAYQSKLGTNQDTKELRVQMKEDIAHGNRTIMKTINLFQEFDALNLKKKADQDARNKISRRARLSFDLVKDRYTRALREVHRKERAYVDVTKSQIDCGNEEVEEVKTSDLESGKDQEVRIYVKDLEFYKPVLLTNKRVPVRKIYYQDVMNDHGQVKSWQEKAKDLEDVLEKMALEDEKLKSSGIINHKDGIVLLMTVVAVFLLLNTNSLERINE